MTITGLLFYPYPHIWISIFYFLDFYGVLHFKLSVMNLALTLALLNFGRD